VLYATSNTNARKKFSQNGGAVLETASSLMVFTKGELKRITNNYSEYLGRGNFSKVYKGTLPDGTMVAVKVPTKKVNENRENEFAERVIIQTKMIHKNFLMPVGCCLEVDVPILVYEFAPKGSLQDILHGHWHRVPLPLDLCVWTLQLGVRKD
jgi:serine/threonine protein kinase